MKILHLNSGNETGGGMFHILSLLKQLKKSTDVTLGVFHDEVMAQKARNLGIHVKVFKQRSQFDITVARRIKDYIEENNIDILHSHGARANFISRFVKPKKDFKWYLTVHSNPLDDFINQGIKGKIFTKLNIQAIKSADHVIAISERFKNDLIRLGVNEQKIDTILNGIDFNIKPKTYYNREKFDLKEDDFVIIMIARLEPVKDHETALRGLKEVLTKADNIKLVFVGDGSRLDELKSLVKDWGLSDNVLFLGRRDDVTEILTIGDITILTSLSESFPLVLLESARAKKPIISTDVGGVKSLIPNENYGYIINVGDASQLAEKIWKYYLMKKNGKLGEKGELLYNHASKNFSEEAFSQSVLEIYNKYQ
jgi:L-malate glycosyltransferase